MYVVGAASCWNRCVAAASVENGRASARSSADWIILLASPFKTESDPETCDVAARRDRSHFQESVATSEAWISSSSETRPGSRCAASALLKFAALARCKKSYDFGCLASRCSSHFLRKTQSSASGIWPSKPTASPFKNSIDRRDAFRASASHASRKDAFNSKATCSSESGTVHRSETLRDPTATGTGRIGGAGGVVSCAHW
mmetsp:Transcript_18052/g.60876  ORF Transcript_18052/g.60876 Transcript_18052/m.60876 type:complete len:201 (-) Transcript_18052:2730-3332(-)